MALAVQLTRMERQLRDERLAADVKAAQLEGTVRRLEAQVAAEQQRRQSEQLRAIVEGATHGCFGFSLSDPRMLVGQLARSC